MAAPAAIDGRDFGTVVCKALGLDPDYVRRLIIDIPTDGPIVVYVEQYVSDAVFGVDWSSIKSSFVIQRVESDGRPADV